MVGEDYPVIIKPSREGSTIGITKVCSADELETAFEHALKYDSDVLVEHFVEGDELTVAILDGIALPVVRIVAPNNNYDYEAKYHSSDTKYFCPSGLEESVDLKVQEMAMRAFRSLECSGWGRVDILLDKNHQPWVLEVNTVPGMTDHSLVPLAARAAGLSFDELVLKILLTTDVA
jgi:D-alanine-D-alanine ligase